MEKIFMQDEQTKPLKKSENMKKVKKYIEKYLAEKNLNLTATLDAVREDPPSSKKLSSIPTLSIPSAFSKISQSAL